MSARPDLKIVPGGGHGDGKHSAEHDDEHDDEHGHGSHGGGGDHEEGGHGEPWLVSYADLMTLLFGFFVLMYSFEAAKNANPQKSDPSMVSIQKELARYFGGPQADRLDKLGKDFAKVAEKFGLTGQIDIQPTPTGFQVILSSSFLFDAGDVELTPKAASLVETLVQLIYVRGDTYDIRAEGYTDDSVPSQDSPYASNWALSAARAASVIDIFETNGYDPKKLSAVGMGSSHPVVPNLDENHKPLPANRARNRRVTIFVSEPAQAALPEAAKSATPPTSAEGEGANVPTSASESSGSSEAESNE